MVKELGRPDQQPGTTPVPDVYHRAFTDQGSTIGSTVPAVGGDRRGMSPIVKGVLIGADALLLLGGTELAVRGVTGHFYPQALDNWLAGLTHADTNTGNTGNTGGTGKTGPENTATPTVVTPEISQTQIQTEIDTFHKATGDTYTYRVESTGAVTFVDATKGVDVAVVNSTITIQKIDKQGHIVPGSTVTTPNLQFIGPKQGDTQPSAGQQLQQKIYEQQELNPATGKPKTNETHIARNPFILPSGAKLTITVYDKYPMIVTYQVTLQDGQTLTIVNPAGTSTLVETNDTYVDISTMQKYQGTLGLFDPQHATTAETNIPGSFAEDSHGNSLNGKYVDSDGVVGSGSAPATVDGKPMTATVSANDGQAILPFTVGGLVVGGIIQG